MATKTTVLSPNASVISFSQGATLEEVKSAVNDEIVKTENGHGWTLHDADAGPNKICYKSLNKDGLTYKYFVLDYSVVNQINFAAYGSWDEVAHTGTEVATHSGYYADLKFTDRGNIYLFISPRWLAFCVKQFSSPVIYSTLQSGIGGIFEIARDNPDDTVEAGYPPYCILTTGNAGNVGSGSINTDIPVILLPKSLSGIDNQVGQFSTVFGKSHQSSRLNAITPNVVNPFSNKDWAITPYIHGPGTEVRGRIFGLKLYTQNKLYFMDKVSVNCDEDWMYDPEAETPTDHYVIPAGYFAYGAYNVRCLIPV